MFKDGHNHELRNATTRLPSPIRQSISKYVKFNLTQGQIKTDLSLDHPDNLLSTNKLINAVIYAHRRDNPTIFSVYDFNHNCALIISMMIIYYM